MKRLGIEIDAQSRIAELRIGEQQLVEIAKALSLDARILIMDEPTSALSTAECETLFKVVRQLAQAGVAIIYTSHRLDEVVALANRVTVLRDGQRVLTAPIERLSPRRHHFRDGRAGGDAHPPGVRGRRGRARSIGAQSHPRQGKQPRLAARAQRCELRCSAGRNPRHWRTARIGTNRDSRVRSSASRAVGEAAKSPSTASRFQSIRRPTPAALGVAMVTEDRKALGLHIASTIRDNVALPSVGAASRFGVRGFARESALAADVVERLQVRCSGIDQIAATLSGGNQQKVAIGKWLATNPRVLLLDEPTRGIDVGAKQEIYQLIFRLAAEGLAIVVVTSEMPELLLLSDRVLVMCEGRQTGVLSGAEATQEAIMRLAAPGMSDSLAGDAQ